MHSIYTHPGGSQLVLASFFSGTIMGWHGGPHAASLAAPQFQGGKTGSCTKRNKPWHLDLAVSWEKPAIRLLRNLSVSDIRIKPMAGFFAFIRSNLCTRHIRDKLTPRGHHESRTPSLGSGQTRYENGRHSGSAGDRKRSHLAPQSPFMNLARDVLWNNPVEPLLPR